MEAFVADMDLMFNNAKLYNADESQIFEDAVTLQVMPFVSFIDGRTFLRKLRKRNGRRSMRSILIVD
jgi:hypothetical protein